MSRNLAPSVEVEDIAPRASRDWRFVPAARFGQYAQSWQSLLSRRPSNPVIDAAFVETLITVFGSGKEVLAMCGEPDDLCAMGLLTRCRPGSWETFQPSQHPLSAWVHRPDVSYEGMMSSLMKALPGMPLILSITQKDPDIHPRPEESACLRTLDYVRTAKIVVDRPFEEYWSARDHNVRRQVERRAKRLRQQGIAAHLDEIRDAEAVVEAIAEFGRIESAGWKGRSGTAIHSDNPQGAFYTTLFRTFCRRGGGVVYRYRFNDATVAMELCIESGGTLVMLKTTYDEAQRVYAPGMLMRHEIFERAFASGYIKKIEFLGALQLWQEKWCDEVRTLYHVNYYRWPWLVPLQRLRSAWRPREDGEPLRGEARAQVAIYEDLSALPERYEAVFRKAGQLSLFHTLPWYGNFARTVLAPDERLRIYAVEGASKKARGVLMMRHGERRRSALSPFVLTGLSNYYSSLFGPIIDPEDKDIPGTLRAIAATIAADSARWDVIDLHPLALDDAMFPQLVRAFRSAGFLAHPYFCFGNWYLKVNGQCFQEYIQGRPSRISKTGQRRRRKLERSGRFRFRLHTGVEDLESALADYNTVYRSSWKPSEPYPDFIGGLMRVCAAQGWLRLGIVYLDGQPAATQLWTVVHRTASIFKLAYDERYAKDSLGTVLSSLLMEHVIDVDKVQIVDYLTGDDPYKRDWMCHRRQRCGIVAFNPRSVHGLLAAAKHQAGQTVKRVAGLMRSQSVEGCHEART